MFSVEFGDHGKFIDLSPTIQQLYALWPPSIHLLLGTWYSAQLYNSCSHQENILKIFFLVMIRVWYGVIHIN